MTIQDMLKGLISAAVLAAAGSSVATAAPLVHKCGAPVNSIVITENTTFSTSATAFVNVPGAGMTFTVPAGKAQCVKVRFSTMMRCKDSASIDECFFRVVVVNGSIFDPAINGITFAAEGNVTTQVQSFEWVKRLTAGQYTVRVQAAVQAAATVFDIFNWTADFEITD